MEEIIAAFREVAIADIGILWRKRIPNAVGRDQVASKFTSRGYARKIFTTILQRHPNAKEFHLINDRYDMGLSIKDAKQKKRSALFISGAKNVYPYSIDTIPQARKFSSFFANLETKIRLKTFLLDEFKELAPKKEINYTFFSTKLFLRNLSQGRNSVPGINSYLYFCLF